MDVMFLEVVIILVYVGLGSGFFALCLYVNDWDPMCL